jgi:dTDP-4-dehydrorhamnose reductase
MKIVVTGAGGQLGRELIRYAASPGLELTGVTREQLDITSSRQIDAVLTKCAPEVIINTAAYTQVDAAESDPERAFAVNATGAGLLAQWCRNSGCMLVHVSTDYVFDGRKRFPYIESDAVAPVNVYGASKAKGETLVRERLLQHLIVRTSWLYGPYGKNFVKTIIALAGKKEVLPVVADQYGSPTSTYDLAGAILKMTADLKTNPSPPWGTYHYCCRGVVSWHDFAAEIIRRLPRQPAGRHVRTEPIPTSAYPTPARRPAYSGLDCTLFETTFDRRPAEWTEALEPVVTQILTPGSRPILKRD